MEKEQTEQLPLVSIFAICHNHALYVIDTLESIKNQTYSPIQLIIIDNFSSDGSSLIIDKWISDHNYPCEFIKNLEPYLITKNFNIGFSYVNGKYFQGISCDDIMLPEKISKQVAIFEDLHDDYCCVFSDMMTVNEKGISNSKITYLDRYKENFKTTNIPNGSLRKELSQCCVVPAPSALLRTSAFIQSGGYDERLEIEDWPMFILLSKLGFKFWFINEVLVKYRILPKSLSKIVRFEKFRDIIILLKENSDYLFTEDIYFRQKWFTCVLYVTWESKIEGINKYFEYMRYTRDYKLKRMLQFFFYGFINRVK